MGEKRLHKPTQCEKILKYLHDFGKITTFEAFTELGIARLASRIWNLKEQGYKFTKKRIYTNNRWGEITHYDEYRLVGETK